MPCGDGICVERVAFVGVETWRETVGGGVGDADEAVFSYMVGDMYECLKLPNGVLDN